MDILKISNYYDSHLHWLGTAELIGSQFKILPTGLSAIDLNLFLNDHRQLNSSGWLYFFGYDSQDPIHRELFYDLNSLDKIFSDFPVMISNKSGHSSILNSKGASLLQLSNSQYKSHLHINPNLNSSFKPSFNPSFEPSFEPSFNPSMNPNLNSSFNQSLSPSFKPHFKPSFNPSYEFHHKDHFQNYKIVNKKTKAELAIELKKGADYFLSLGITHFRDMTSDLEQFNTAIDLIENQGIKQFVELNFDIQKLTSLSKCLSDLKYAKFNSIDQVKVKGIKFFLDGDISSQTAAISSDNYKCDFFDWEDSEIEEIISKTWSQQLEVSVHAIGNLAVEKILKISRKISSKGLSGRLNIEHAEVLTENLFKLMKPLHVRLHFQPQHWPMDKNFLQKYLKQDLYFALHAAEKNHIPFSIGSDSPVVKPSVFETIDCIHSILGKRQLKNKITDYLSYPDKTSVQAETIINLKTRQIEEVNFK